MHALTNKKAVSTFILVILLLCSIVFGAFISYMWVMANFYLEPENTSLTITQADFPVAHADYFYVTVMNPSHSPSGTNITEIYLTVENDTKLYKVTNTSPETLPIRLEKGTNKTIKCLKNWGEFAGKTVAVHVSALDASGAVSKSVETGFVKLELEAKFNATVSCKYFNATIRNDPQSAINLSLTKIYVNNALIENLTLIPSGQNVSYPINVLVDETISLQCLYNWETIKNPTVRAETSEGYYVEASINATANVLLLINDVAFNETNSNEISISVFNSETSSNPVDISDIVLTYRNGTQSQEYPINGSNTNPSFAVPYRLDTNTTVTFNHCIWNWRNFREQNVTITVYVKQGFTPVSKTVKTPSPVVFKITELNFNLTDVRHFLVKIFNMPCSLREINITSIKLSEANITVSPQIILVGEEKVINCSYYWAGFRGINVNITAYTKDGLSTPPKSITLPVVDLKLLVLVDNFAKSTEGIPYVNITIVNTLFSNRTVKVTQITFRTENTTETINGALTNPVLVPNGYTLTVGANVTILCPWNWTLHSHKDLTITVQTAEGFIISLTFQIP